MLQPAHLPWAGVPGPHPVRMKTVVILRGAMGCGKTTFATLLDVRAGAKVVSADKWFRDNQQEWSPEKLGTAHHWCQEQFVQALIAGRELVIVDNTNQTPRDFDFYERAALAHGYQVHFLVVENRRGGQSVHAVPEAMVERARARIKGTIQL